MLSPALEIMATPFAKLPAELHWTGEPNAWVRTTRPGSRLHSFIEGPCFDREGNLWLVDVPYGRIFCIDAHGGWTLVHAYDGEPHAIRAREDGTFVVADYRRGLLSYDPATDRMSTLCERVNTEPFRGLGDLVVAANGDIWMTDPGRSSLSDPTGRIYRVRAGSVEAELVLANVPYPNGIALTPDGRGVLVSATRANAVWRFLADHPDPAWPMVGLFLQLSGGLGPDGLAVDRHGRVAVAQAQAGRVYVFDDAGDPLALIHTPSGAWTTACTFSGDERELFIVEAQAGVVLRADISTLPSSRPKGVRP